MNAHLVSRTRPSDAPDDVARASQPAEFRGSPSGVYTKTRADAGGGWGLVLVDVSEPPRAVALADGAVIGSASREACIERPGIAAAHARVSVRSDGCYLEDLGSPEGTYVGGVRAERIDLVHGDVVRLGRQLAVFVERDLASYVGRVERQEGFVFGPKQRRDWVGPTLDLAQQGSRVCIEGGAGAGKRTLARLATSLREAAGAPLVIDATRREGDDTIPVAARQNTWLVLGADRLARPAQIEIARAVERGVCVIATAREPLDRAAGDGHVAPWFASLFAGRRVAVPPLDSRRADILPIVGEICARRRIALDRLGTPLLEGLLRAGWPGGVPQLDEAIATAAAATSGGPLAITTIAGALSRPKRVGPSSPPSSDASLARARLEDALARAGGSVASAARSLGMSRQAIYREAERLGLEIPRRRARS